MTRSRVNTDTFVAAVGKAITTARILWIVAVLIAGGIGTGVGLLIGEGRARASFEGRFVDVERRLTAIEISQVEDRAVRTQILSKLDTALGRLETIQGIVLRGSASGATP